MEVELSGAGKRFDRNWVFRHFNQRFIQGSQTAVLGANGSGKSTLLKVISGLLSLGEGEINYSIDEKTIVYEDVYKRLSISSPWLELPSEYSLSELIVFHAVFKPFVTNYSKEDILAILELPNSTDKPFKYLSSGMKQRVKLGLAIISKSDLVLLDEPLTALDAQGVSWYQQLISNHLANRTFIVFSNHKEEEYFFCNRRVAI